MEAMGHFAPFLKHLATIVFYYTKYWSTVSHFSPGTGVLPAKGYTAELVAAVKKDPAAFEKFIKGARKSTTGSIVYPTPLCSWWDITQPSLTPDQIPMGAGKPGVDKTPIASEKIQVVPLEEERLSELKSFQKTLSAAAGAKAD